MSRDYSGTIWLWSSSKGVKQVKDRLLTNNLKLLMDTIELSDYTTSVPKGLKYDTEEKVYLLDIHSFSLILQELDRLIKTTKEDIALSEDTLKSTPSSDNYETAFETRQELLESLEYLNLCKTICQDYLSTLKTFLVTLDKDECFDADNSYILIQEC